MKSILRLLLVLIALVVFTVPSSVSLAQPPGPDVLFSDRLDSFDKDNWHPFGALPDVAATAEAHALTVKGPSQIFLGDAKDQGKLLRDAVVQADITVSANDSSCGLMLRADRQTPDHSWRGYWACVRKLEGYAIVQLYRFPDAVLLQEARIHGEVKANQKVRLKVVTKAASIWVWANDMTVPAITEYDKDNIFSGFYGLKSESGTSSFSNFSYSQLGATPRQPLITDWSWIKGAVYISSNCVNSYQMWEEYKPEIIDRELGYAQAAGLNTVQVYLNPLYWQKASKVYLQRIENFLKLADKHRLKTTFIFFDDVGNVEPPHLAPYAEPIPGIHNSQMQGAPGRAIIDTQYAANHALLKAYVQGVVNAHKNDPRIVFWQTYNEPSHATTLPLLADSYAWIKETESEIPVTATGGGAFYGSYYSDFPSFHSYLDPNAPALQNMVLGDGGPEHVCTETLDRPAVDIPKLVKYFGERKTGWVIWELMIGKDNCRFPWGSPKNAPEPAVPFHGLIYPDGRPCSADDLRAILGG